MKLTNGFLIRPPTQARSSHTLENCTQQLTDIKVPFLRKKKISNLRYVFESK